MEIKDYCCKYFFEEDDAWFYYHYHDGWVVRQVEIEKGVVVKMDEKSVELWKTRMSDQPLSEEVLAVVT